MNQLHIHTKRFICVVTLYTSLAILHVGLLVHRLSIYAYACACVCVYVWSGSVMLVLVEEATQLAMNSPPLYTTSRIKLHFLLCFGENGKCAIGKKASGDKISRLAGGMTSVLANDDRQRRPRDAEAGAACTRSPFTTVNWSLQTSDPYQ